MSRDHHTPAPLRALIGAATQVGWRVVPIRKGFMLRSPDGTTQVLLHHSPSDWRAIHNARAQLRRAGVAA